jgi:hypothetical protein
MIVLRETLALLAADLGENIGGTSQWSLFFDILSN